MLKAEGDGSTLAGALQVARERQWEVVPAIRMDATPGGTVTDEVVETFWRAFRETAEREEAGGMQGVCLNMHGAMVSELFPDVKGEILRRVRGVPALAGLPLCGSLDLHGNYTQAMARHGSGLIAYRENPHTNSMETAVRAARLLDRLMETGERPVTVSEQPPIVWPPSGTGTRDDPMRLLEARARQIKLSIRRHGGERFLGFSFADVAETGVSFSAITLGDAGEARALLQGMCGLAMEDREQGERAGIPLDQAMALLVVHREGPVLLLSRRTTSAGARPAT